MMSGILHTENTAQENLVCMRPVEVSGHIFSRSDRQITQSLNQGEQVSDGVVQL